MCNKAESEIKSFSGEKKRFIIELVSLSDDAILLTFQHDYEGNRMPFFCVIEDVIKQTCDCALPQFCFPKKKNDEKQKKTLNLRKHFLLSLSQLPSVWCM
jgi:hypothetical protein